MRLSYEPIPTIHHTEHKMEKITFYRRFADDILSGRKTITLRDKSDADYKVGDKVEVSGYEDNVPFCHIEVLEVTPVSFDQLQDAHAQQENMTLAQLKAVIAEIYPGITELFMIKFMLLE